MSEDKKADNTLTEITEEDQDAVESEPDSQTAQIAIEKLSKKSTNNEVTEFMAMMGTGSMPNPLHKKMNEGHITQVLQLAANHDEREYNLHKNSQSNNAKENIANRRYTFAAFVILFILIVVILILFKNSPETLAPVMTGIGGLIGGFLGGWGFSRSRDNNTST